MALYQELHSRLLEADAKGQLTGPTLVGVITPYRDQVNCIRAAFQRHVPGLAQNVTIFLFHLTYHAKRWIRVACGKITVHTLCMPNIHMNGLTFGQSTYFRLSALMHQSKACMRGP